MHHAMDSYPYVCYRLKERKVKTMKQQKNSKKTKIIDFMYLSDTSDTDQICLNMEKWM